MILGVALLASGCIGADPDEPVVIDEDEGPIRYVRNSSFTGPNLEVFIEFGDDRRGTVWRDYPEENPGYQIDAEKRRPAGAGLPRAAIE